MKIINTTDNNTAKPSKIGFGTTEFINLETVANCVIGDLPDTVFVFPKTVKKEYKEQLFCSLTKTPDANGDVMLITGNMMGFVGISAKGNAPTYLKIRSRFDAKSTDDYFLYHMLLKVLDINLVNFKFSTGAEQIFEFLYCLFPPLLKSAVNQGLFKQYQKFQHNDANIRGVIDFSRHIKENVPFLGKVSYKTREFTMNNPMTQLIRHTIEKIRRHKIFHSLLRNDTETTACVQKIIQITPNYNAANLREVLAQNTRLIRHPYFTDYTELQRLCIQILKNERVSFETKDTKQSVFGIIFDGSALWEEYLYKVFLENHVAISHPNNRTGDGRDRLFTKRRAIYPDFVRYLEKPKTAVLVADAKYKHKAKREDYYQICTYMYRYKSKGYILYPYDGGEIDDDGVPIVAHRVNTILGNEANECYDLVEYGLHIPQKSNSFNEFRNGIIEQENKLSQYLNA